MNKYYISITLGEGIPDYDFCIKAENEMQAKDIASKIINTDYPEIDAEDLWIREVTAIELLEIMTLN